MSGFTVCPACGTRMKAGRGHCLRCFTDLPVEGARGPEVWWKSLQLSESAALIAGGVLSVVIATVGLVLWETSGTEVVDDTVRPTVVATAAAPPPASLPPGSAIPSLPPPTVYEPPFVDAVRDGTPSIASGNVDAARTAYEQVLAKRPDDSDALNNLGLVLVRLGRPDEGIARFERAVQLAPGKWEYRFNLAHAEGQILQWDRAIAEYRAAAALAPSDSATQFNLAMALHKNGNDAAAIPTFEKAIELAPAVASFHVSLGISFEKMGRIPDALRAYRHSLELDPASADAENLRAHVAALDAPQQAATP